MENSLIAPPASIDWFQYLGRLEGTSVVRKVWKGRANLVELEVDGSTGHIEGLSLRLYNPQSHQWSLNFAGSNSGALGQPTIGEFKNGRGEFLTRNHLMAEPFLFETFGRISHRIRAALNKHSPMMGERHGR